MALDSLHTTQQSNTTLSIASNAAGSRGEEFNENREKEKRGAGRQARGRGYLLDSLSPHPPFSLSAASLCLLLTFLLL